MIKKEFRLKKKYQFNYTYHAGETVGERHLLICFAKSKNKVIKIGLSVTKKVGNAVTRNRVKRLLRASISPVLSKLKKDYNLIIIARPTITSIGLNEISEELMVCLKKAGLFNENI
ncbi:MAG: ribonuclease P protein component [Clostridia bacterium]|nr:ribonuclease P protein component [Clostridia bacterium]